MKPAGNPVRPFLASLAVLGCLWMVGAQPVVGNSIEDTVLLGRMTRAEIEAALPDWVLAQVEAEPDIDAAFGLADVVTSAEVTVYFGSWCSDSRRELARLWKALDIAGEDVGFPLRYVGVDRSKTEPAADIGDMEILYVPTFVIERDGVEAGQIIEQSPEGVEVDLLALLEGRATGWISAREDLPHVEDEQED